MQGNKEAHRFTRIYFHWDDKIGQQDIEKDYYDKDENLVNVTLEVDFWYNLNKFSQALALYRDDKDLDLFLSKVMPEMIVSPKEFKTVNVLDEDFTAKQLLAAALIEIETKKLKSQQKRKTLRITEN